MKQTACSFLETIKDEILTLNKKILEFNEDCFHEENSCDYIINVLNKYGFKTEKNLLGMPTAFKASIGSGQPEICFICKYSTGSSEGHIYGNNANCAMSVGACLALSSIINKLNGTVCLIGCPGRYSNGSEIIMAREGIFDENSIIFCPHADNTTSLYNSSLAAQTYEIHYSNFKPSRDINISALDLCLQTVHFINELIENTESTCYMDHLHLYCDNAVNEYPTSAVAKFEVKARSYSLCDNIESHIRKYLSCVEVIMNVRCKMELVELPCMELIDSSSVNKIFDSNLKEVGIINSKMHKDVLYPLGIGTVSHSTPTIYPSIDIVGDKSVHCPSVDFMNTTVMPYAEDNIIKAVKALALTAIDFMERPDLIVEATSYLSQQIQFNNHL